MKQFPLVFGVTVLTLGILSAVPAVRATEPPEVDANGRTIGEPFPPDSRVSLSLPLHNGENLTYGAVTESSRWRGIGERAEPASSPTR